MGFIHLGGTAAVRQVGVYGGGVVCGASASASAAGLLRRSPNDGDGGIVLLQRLQGPYARGVRCSRASSTSSTTVEPVPPDQQQPSPTTRTTSNNDHHEDNSPQQQEHPKDSFLARLIHGTREMSLDEILPGPAMASTTHSQMVASTTGVLHEMETHKIIPGKTEAYINLVREYHPLISERLGPDRAKLFAAFTVDIGELDTAFHFWEFKGYAGLTESLRYLRNQEFYQTYRRQLGALVTSRRTDICLPFAFWKTVQPSFEGGMFELRRYQLKPGRLLEWEQHWRQGFECRRQFCEPVGGWFTQLGALHHVFHLWVYPDLEKRKQSREKAWQVKGWAETVYNTVRLVNKMDTNILRPLPGSPVQ